MRINLKSDTLLLAIIFGSITVAAILILTMPRTVKAVSTVTTQPVGKVKSVTITAPDGVSGTTNTTHDSPATNAATTQPATGDQTSIVAAPTTTPSTPTTPAAPAQPIDTCEANGLVLVPVGGKSCSYVAFTLTGDAAQWYLPALYSFTDGTGAIEKPNAPVYVVIESQSDTTGLPFTASSITFHYAALASAPLGDYIDGSDGLKFSVIGPDGTPSYAIGQPQLTVVAN